MNWKNFGKAILFPNRILTAILTPIAIALLFGAVAFWGSQSVLSYLSYALAFYVLTVWCIKIPRIVAWIRKFKRENRYARRWASDARLRVTVSLYSSLIWNVAYGAFQLGLGVYHRTVWFGSLGAYYVLLALMRIFLVRHTRRHAPGENLRQEYSKLRAIGWIFLIMNLALSLIIFFMVYWQRTFEHHMITAIAFAAYTFASLTVAIVNAVKYRKYKSPVYTAATLIGLMAACVSVLTLESTMLTAFGGESMSAVTQKTMLGLTGGVISALCIAMAIYMIVNGSEKLKEDKQNRRLR